MTAQVVQLIPLFGGGATSTVLDYHWWQQQGWKGILFALVTGVIAFGIAKSHIGFISIGPNEGGIRELFGLKLWKLGPGPHFHITGFSTVRKVSLAIKQFSVRGSVETQGRTYNYRIAVKAHVDNTREALIARIYSAEDNDKTNMVNNENERQIIATLTQSSRKLLTRYSDIDMLEERLTGATKQQLAKYGYVVDEVIGEEFVLRPLAELAKAVGKQNQEQANAPVIDIASA